MQKRHGVQPTQRNFKQTINGPRIKLIIFPSAAKKSIISENNWPIFPLELKESHWSMSFEYYLFYTLLRCSCGKTMQNYLCCFQSPRWTQLLTWEACHWACPEHTGAPEGVWQALSSLLLQYYSLATNLPTSSAHIIFLTPNLLYKSAKGMIHLLCRSSTYSSLRNHLPSLPVNMHLFHASINQTNIWDCAHLNIYFSRRTKYLIF